MIMEENVAAVPDRQGPEQDGRVYALKHPFTYCGEAVETLPLRRIKARDQIAVEREIAARAGRSADEVGTQERSIYLLARITGKPVELIEELDGSDLAGLQMLWGAHFF